MDRLTQPGAKGIRAFCSGCSDKPLLGKCNIGAECYHRQVFKALRAYEDTGLTPEEITQINDFAQSQCAKLLAENASLKEELELAEAALGEAVGIIKGLLVIRDSDFSFVTMSTYTGAKLKADQFLQSPVVEQAGERRRALEAQNEIMRGALEAIIVLDKDSITGNARAYYMQRIAKDALDACERVKGE